MNVSALMNNYSELISKNEEDQKRLVAAAETIREEYVKQAGSFLRKWFEDHAKRTATSQPEITAGLKPEGIKTLKAEITALADRADEIAVTVVGSCKYWRNLTKPLSERRADYGPINTALRTAAARIAPILQKRGFRQGVEKKEHGMEMGGTLGEDEAMGELRSKYDKAVSDLVRKQAEKLSIQDQHKRDEAANLWDSA
jgi:hypothetical protein